MSTRAGFVAIVGRPNAGKSTLLNRVLGARLSIVTPKAQTTRERVLGILSEAERQIVFVDTPGIHRARPGGINEFMVNEAREAASDVSAVWYLVDPSSAAEHEKPVLELLSARRGTPVLIVLSKSDLPFATPAHLAKLGEEIAAAAREAGIQVLATLALSAEKGGGVDALLAATWPLVPESPFYFPDTEQLSDRPTRFFVAEKVREQLLLQLGQELPYACAVEIEKFDEKGPLPRIEATIHVERDSQKGMVVGAGGQKIKAIGQAARREVEEFLGKKVFLGLRVQVLKDWSRDTNNLKRLGYDVGGKGRRK